MMNANLELYSPTKAQLKIHLSPHQYNVLCFGRQSGKSTFGNNKLIDKAWKKENGIFWYVGPTYRLAEQMHDRAIFALRNSAALRDQSKSDLMVRLKYGESRIFYKSGDNPGALLGETVDGAIIDECREQKKEIWTHYLMPMLGTTNGWCDFLSTPNGFDWFYDLYQNKSLKNNWGGFHAPSLSNPLWTKEKIEEAKSEMSEDLFAQEIMAEFRDIGAGVCYTSFGKHNILEKSPFAMIDQEISPFLPIVVGMDFNLHPMSWVLGQNRTRDIYWHDEIYLKNSNTQEAAFVLAEKVKGHKPGVVIIGDFTGGAGQRAAAGKSDYDIIKQVLKEYGVHFQDRTPTNGNPRIKDRVNTVNASLKSADNSVHMWFHPRCINSIKDMQRVKWKEGSSSLAFDNSDQMLTHLADAIGYACCVLAPIKGVGNVGKMHIVSRSF